MAGGVSQKHLFERGQKGAFGLYSELQKLDQKIRSESGNLDLISTVVPFYESAKTYFEENC